MPNKNRPRWNFTEEFKEQIVQLYLSGKSKADIQKEYDLYPSTLNHWIKQHQNTGSFKMSDNLKDFEKELKELGKQNKQLEIWWICEYDYWKSRGYKDAKSIYERFSKLLCTNTTN